MFKSQGISLARFVGENRDLIDATLRERNLVEGEITETLRYYWIKNNERLRQMARVFGANPDE